jgi:hypothetical protein
MSKMKVEDILRGCRPGRIQSVGCMQVIPLVSDISDDRFASPSEAKVSTSHYGTLAFKNPTRKTMIVPAQAAYVVKQAAQDHALPHAGIVKKGLKKSFNTAMCIEQTQGGYIHEGDHDIIILPFLLREQAHKVRNDTGYDRLWGSIDRLNKETGVGHNRGGHLNVFLGHFEKQLKRFVAEFEHVPDQVGAIILVGGEIVGIERTPSHQYWLSVWPTLVRECYGSLAIYWAEKKGDNLVPGTRVALREAKSLADLKKALKEAGDEEYAKVKETVENIASLELDSKNESSEEGLDIEALSSTRFVGQVVKDGEAIVYGSLVATEKWRKGSDWLKKADPFKM